MAITQLSQLDLRSLKPPGNYHPSPVAWEDHVFYFLLIDRFSDNNEAGYMDIAGITVTTGSSSVFTPADSRNAIQNKADAAEWRAAGGKYVGGNLKGLTSKIGYLKRMGITAIWVSPVLKQVHFQETYHGYGIQDFLQVNPQFGTDQDFKDLVKIAHDHGIYVILDIILNHVGDIFSYDPTRQPNYQTDSHFDPRWDRNPYPVLGFNDPAGNPTIPFVRTDPANPAGFPDQNGAIWPVEFQNPGYYTQKGRITNFDYDPEFREGDFFDLKDVNHGAGDVDTYLPSQALQDLAEVYKYWIAFADIDGFRIDTVKHMDLGATRFFTSAMHEFAQSIGKDNLLLTGEITGGREFAFNTMQLTGLNAALGIADIPGKLEFLVKGVSDPNEYFSLFRNSELIGKGTHTWFRNKVVTFFNDHDQVGRDPKERFCANPSHAKLVLNALALNVATLGIPCIYYGTEQRFNGHGGGDGGDRYIREAMFGGSFGSYESEGVHFFDEDSPVYQELAKIIQFRKDNAALRRGRQYLRPISGDGQHFGLPTLLGGQIHSIVPWSRILSETEILLAINTDPDNAKTAWVTVDNSLHKQGNVLTCLYSTDPGQIGTQVQLEPRNGLSVQLTVSAAGFVVFG
ncbi:alpha-amylase family glycosyl hydrolase [Spirosoma endophyticum]|uniref:Glycosidase n=1 Tax=Spirosoma endophyticum TaxID=662367 RepID=A0A1I1W966_9BACT|nr:alpha-amylase family glycosyl hydrolase [Spirosoma endophyticum]SFD91736.1 Glycosidase [Spirosoma endophyticum]